MIFRFQGRELHIRMRCLKLWVIALLFFFLCAGEGFWCPIANAATKEVEAATATVNEHAASVPLKNIAYFEAGPYWEFSLLFEKVVDSLKRKQILDKVRFPESLHSTPGWDVPAAVYAAEAKRLMSDPSVDLIISMGTVATKALLDANNGRTPIVSIDVADPVGAGIIDAVSGKGAPNLTLQYTPDKWQKVFVLFHQALLFTKMGIMYHDSPEGRSYSNVNEAREVARDRGFTLVEYARLDQEESIDSCVAGMRYLVDQGVDALYISALNCFDWNKGNPREIFDYLHSHGIKTLARDGTVQVKRGALLGLSTLDYASVSDYYVGQIAHLLGFMPERALVVQSSYSPKITLNLDTASTLKLDIPLILLIAADEIFDSSLAGVRNETKTQ